MTSERTAGRHGRVLSEDQTVTPLAAVEPVSQVSPVANDATSVTVTSSLAGSSGLPPPSGLGTTGVADAAATMGSFSVRKSGHEQGA
jgi:hypothetical protein